MLAISQGYLLWYIGRKSVCAFQQSSPVFQQISHASLAPEPKYNNGFDDEVIIMALPHLNEIHPWACS